MDLLVRDIVYLALKSSLFNLPGDCLLREYREIYPGIGREMIPRLFSDMDAEFPKQGIVRRSGNYFYLELKDQGGYIRAGPKLLASTEKLSPGHSFFSPPSPVGSHVTLRGSLESELGRTYSFTLDQKIVSYPHEKGGKSPSGFDPTLYPVSWYVKGLPYHLTNLYDPPHISIAVSGFRR